MSWVCEFCDSTNEESSRQCFVCGHDRSAESIRESKARAREEKMARLSEGIAKNVCGATKVAFMAGLGVSSLAVAIIVIIKIINGQLDDIWRSLTAVTGRAWDNISVSFGKNFPSVSKQVSYGALGDFPANCKALGLIVSANISDFPQIAFGILPNTAKNSIVDSYENRIVPMAGNVSSNLGTFGSVITGLFSSIKGSVEGLVNVFSGMINSVIKHFK